MTQFSTDPPPPGSREYSPAGVPYYDPPPKTSGMAIASFVCGILGLLTCCAVAPGALGVTFGAVALPAIGRGERRGRGLAIGGMVLGGLGMLLGIALWVAVWNSPAVEVVSGEALTAAQKETLRAIGAVEEGETITLMYSDGMFSIRESGIVLTDQRIVRYGQVQGVQAWPLEDVKAIDFTPGSGMWAEGTFLLESGDRDLMSFSIPVWETGDKHFDRALRKAVDAARAAVGRPPATGAVAEP